MQPGLFGIVGPGVFQRHGQVARHGQPEQADNADAVIEDAIRRLGDRVRVLHMKDFTLTDGEVKACACGTGGMRYERLLALGLARDLPMTLENTVPDNAEQARLHLEHLASQLK